MIKKITGFIYINDEFFVYPFIRKIKSNEEYKRLFSNFLSLSFLQAANYILPLITLPYLVRVLGPEKFGLIAFSQAFIAYFGVLTDYGFNLSATREISINRENKEKVSEIFNSVMIIKSGFLILSLLIMTVIVFSFEKFRKDWIIYYLTFGMVLGQVLFPVWFFQGMERMKYITFLNILAKLIFTVAIFVFVRNSSHYIYVPLINSLGFIIAGILALWIVFKDFGVKVELPSYDAIKRELKEGWHIFVSGVFGSFYRDSNTFILGIFATNTLVAYYFVGEKIIKVIQTLQDIAGRSLFPYFSRKYEYSKKYFFELNKKYLKYIFTGYFFLTILVFLFSNRIIVFIYGAQNTIARLNLEIMSPVILIGGFNYYFGVLGLITMNFKKEFSKYIITTGVFNLIFCSILIYLYPKIGAPFSLLVSEILLLFLILRKVISIKRFTYDLS